MKNQGTVRRLGYGLSGIALAWACGPVAEVPFDDVGSTTEVYDGSGGSDDGSTTGEAAGGSGMDCGSLAPPQTYVCAGSAWEREAAGAAALVLSTEPAQYACIADPYWYYYYGGSGGYYGGDGDTGYYEGDGDGDTGYYEGDGDGDGTGGWYGYGGEPAYGGAWGTGGAYPSSGGSGSYPSGDLLSDWCDGLDSNDLLTGASFAVGQCTITDLAIPIKFTEPEWGHYEVSVYGGSSQCDRSVLLAKTAGIGTGLPINIPVDPTGFEFISVEMNSNEAWEGIELRLDDRPAVGDAPRGE